MVTEKNIRDAYVHLRTTNNTISDEVLEFIKTAAFEKLAKMNSPKNISARAELKRT